MSSPILIKLNRLSAWLLSGLITVYFLTGFDIAQNFWQADLSRYLHNKILPLPTLICLFFHSMVGLKLFLARNQLENKFLKIIFNLVAFMLFSLLLYLFLR